jgi:hypothetical protein
MPGANMKCKIFLLLFILAALMAMLAACTTDGLYGKEPTGISIASFAKTEYYYSEALDLRNAQIVVTYADNFTRKVDITADMISGYDSTKEGVQTITVTYQNFTAQIQVTVLPLSIQSIDVVEVDQNDKVTIARPIRVVEGGEPNFSKLALRVNYESLSVLKKNFITLDLVSGYSPANCPPREDPYELTITYGGKTAKFYLYVVEKSVEKLIIKKENLPVKRLYYYNNPKFNQDINNFNLGKSVEDAIIIDPGLRYTEILDPTGLKITVVYNNGTEEVVDYASINPEDITFVYQFNAAGDEIPVTVEYLNCLATFNVKVIEPAATGMEITRMPSSRGRYSFVTLYKNDPVPAGAVVELPQYSSSDETRQYIIRTPEADISETDMVQGDVIDWGTGRVTIFFEDGTKLLNVPMDNSLVNKTCSGISNLNVNLNDIGVFTIKINYPNSSWTPLEIGIRVTSRKAIKLFLGRASVTAIVNRNYFVGDILSPELIKYNVFYDNGTFLFGDVTKEEYENPRNWSNGELTVGAIDYDSWTNPSNWIMDSSHNVTYAFTKSAGNAYGWEPLSVNELAVQDSEKCTEPGNHSFQFSIDGVMSEVITVSVSAIVPVEMELIQNYSYYFLVGEDTAGFFENTLRLAVKAFIKYNNGASAQKTLSSDAVYLYKDGAEVYSFLSSEPYTFAEEGTYAIVVEADGAFASLPVYVTDGESEPRITSIAISDSPVSNVFDDFTVFERSFEEFSFDLAYSDGSHKILYLGSGAPQAGIIFAEAKYAAEERSEEDVLILCDRNKKGNQEIIFRYRGVSVSYSLSVIGRWERSIEIIRLPKQLYISGEDTSFDLTGLKIRILYNDGTIVEETDFSSSKWSFVYPYLVLAPGTYYDARTITVVLNGVHQKLKRDYTIELVAGTIQSISVDTNQQIEVGGNVQPLFGDYPDYDGISRKMLSVVYGQPLDLTSFTLTVTYRYTDGEGNMQTAQVGRKITAANINYNPNITYRDAMGNIIYSRLLTITYCGRSTQVWLHLEPGRTLDNIQLIEQPSQVHYTVGQNIDLRGGLLKRIFKEADGSYYYDYIYMTNPDVSVSYDNGAFPIGSPLSYETRPVEVNYKGFSVSFFVTTYKKLTATLEYINIFSRYGTDLNPIISVEESGIPGFELPELKWVYGVPGPAGTVWTDVCPRVPGTYTIKVTVIPNEYYEEMVDTSRSLTIMPKLITLIGNDFNKYYKQSDPDYNQGSQKGYYFLGYEGNDTPLVGNDVIQIRLFRTGAEASENVRFDGTGAILGYTISYELVQGNNQNSYYIFDYTPGKLYIRPLQISGNISFTGYSNLIANGTEQGVTASYINSNNMKEVISQSDIIYTYLDEYGQTQTVTKTVMIGGVPTVVNCPPSLAGTYTARISPNYSISGTYTIQFTIYPN